MRIMPNQRTWSLTVIVLVRLVCGSLDMIPVNAFVAFEGVGVGLGQLRRSEGKKRRTTCLHSEIKFKNFDHVLDTFHEGTLLVYFEANKCGPCHLMKKELAVAKKLMGKEHNLKIFSLDAEKWPHLGTRYGIQKLPCLLLVRDGVIKKRMEGVTDADLIVKELQRLMGTESEKDQ